MCAWSRLECETFTYVNIHSARVRVEPTGARIIIFINEHSARVRVEPSVKSGPCDPVSTFRPRARGAVSGISSVASFSSHSARVRVEPSSKRQRVGVFIPFRPRARGAVILTGNGAGSSTIPPACAWSRLTPFSFVTFVTLKCDKCECVALRLVLLQ